MKRSLLACLFLAAAFGQTPASKLFDQFKDPPRTYTVRPFWFWNDKIEPAEVDRQIREMVSQHVYGAYVHNRTGLQTPYLSDEYWSVVKSGLASAKKQGFLFGFVDEYEWPGGEARDPWRPGLGSRVIEQNPEFRMRSLWFRSLDSAAAGPMEIRDVTNLQFAVAGRLTKEDTLDPESLTLIETAAGATSVTWNAPGTNWRLMAYFLEPSQGRDGGLVDLMNKDVTAAWLKLVHDRYYALAPEMFGTTVDSIFTDHEGDYGRRIAWTPALMAEFRMSKGYDLRKMLPVLSYEAGKPTPKVRCDYLDVVSELYANHYMKQVAEWCERHNIKIGGHAWEENLVTEAFHVGDLQRVSRAWSWPGADSLHDMGRSPRDLKVTASVAHFRQTRYLVENQALQGFDTYQDIQKMRLGTNMLGVWGASVFVPASLNYHPTRIEYPPDWFYHQPYWRFFHHYADYARRIAFMNDSGRHHADILLFQPTETAWANAQPNYAPKPDWSTNPLPLINLYYGDIMNRMAQELRDFDVADSFYLDSATVRDGALHIGPESFRVLILPPLTAVRRSTVKKIEEFYRAGGVVIALRQLPTDSMEDGRDDPVLAAAWGRIFSKNGRGSENGPGRAYFVADGIEPLFPLLDQHLPRDVEAIGGSRQHWGASHRSKDGLDWYWIVNDSAEAREQTFRLGVRGTPEKWDAATGAREALASKQTAQGTQVRLRFAPWDAFYVVFGNPAARVKPREAPDPARPAALKVKGPWRLTPVRKTLEAPYGMRYHRAWDGLGETNGFARKGFNDERWDETWLSREKWTIRDWWIVGPFDNKDHAGCYGAFPPETNPDEKASYGDSKWHRYVAPSMAVDLYSALGMPIGSDGTAYAMTYVYSPGARRVQLRVAANNNAHLWVNGRKLLDWHLHPWYYEMREAFALTREAEFQAGWNQVMVKVSRFRRGTFGFMVRITDGDGNNVDDLTVSLDRALRAPGSTFYTLWYRVAVPATAISVRMPKFRKPVQVFYNGVRVEMGAGGEVRLPAAAEGAGNVLAVLMPADEELRASPVFTFGSAATVLGSWVEQGLPYFSGEAAYETEVDVPAGFAGRRLTLDLGEVGVVAEVHMNGRKVGERAWLPFSFDITEFVKLGRNALKIVVANTMENERAVLERAGKLPKLRHSGLIGPVRIVPGARR
ncbi:MAG: hypothetical protein JNM66_33345 [Bryobacterales bacterium]|nr:hypothetical protein [Bryobacterales bacterium]